MSVLVVGFSHRTAPLRVLERAALSPDAAAELGGDLVRGDHVAEAAVLSTCNRLEIYAEVSKFHGGVAEVGAGLARATGIPLGELTDHLYARYEFAAVSHLFTVTCGLDSMAVGEAQILGQVRTALRSGQESGSVGRSLGTLLQNALRVGKRAHAETGLDQAGPSLVAAGLEHAVDVLGPVEKLDVLVLGAGAMSGLAVATAGRAGAKSIVVSSRTDARAERLAASVGGGWVPSAGLPAALADADVVISCAGATGHLVDVGLASAALAARGGRPQVYLDLALPRDVAPGVAELAGVTVADLEVLGALLAERGLDRDVADARALVTDEVARFLAAQRAETVAPTVVALRAMARSVVDAELARLQSRLGGVDEGVRAELEQTVHRVVEKLLHTPTVRVKELAAEPGGGSYAEALSALFGLGTEPFGGTEPLGQRDAVRLDALADAHRIGTGLEPDQAPQAPEVLR